MKGSFELLEREQSAEVFDSAEFPLSDLVFNRSMLAGVRLKEGFRDELALVLFPCTSAIITAPICRPVVMPMRPGLFASTTAVCGAKGTGMFQDPRLGQHSDAQSQSARAIQIPANHGSKRLKSSSYASKEGLQVSNRRTLMKSKRRLAFLGDRVLSSFTSLKT